MTLCWEWWIIFPPWNMDVLCWTEGVYCIEANASSLNRYIYDRIWFSFRLPSSVPINTSSNIDIQGSGNLYKLPAEVLRTAVQPSNSSTGSLSFNSDYKYNVYFHFAEVEEFEDKVREISIALNGVKRGILKPLSISFHKIKVEITFTIASAATMDSALPPILDAPEFYQLQQFPLSATTHQMVPFLFWRKYGLLTILGFLYSFSIQSYLMQSCPSSKRKT